MIITMGPIKQTWRVEVANVAVLVAADHLTYQDTGAANSLKLKAMTVICETASVRLAAGDTDPTQGATEGVGPALAAGDRLRVDHNLNCKTLQAIALNEGESPVLQVMGEYE